MSRVFMARTRALRGGRELNSANGTSELLVPLLAALLVADLKFFFFLFNFKIKTSFMTEVNFEVNSNMNCLQIE